MNALIEEFAATTRAEIDYLAEGSNAETFATNFADDPRASMPRVVWDLTTRRVLTLEDVSAIKLGDYDAITAAGIDRVQVAKVLVDTYMQQIFEDGFFHADPHPGNLFVTPLEGTDAEGNRNWKLTFIDFGMVGRVPENLRAGLREAIIAVGTQDGARLVKSFKTLDVLLPSADLNLIERASMQLFDRFGGMSMGELREIDHDRDDELRPSVPRAHAQLPVPAARGPALAGPLDRDPLGHVHRARPGVQPVELDCALRHQARVR